MDAGEKKSSVCHTLLKVLIMLGFIAGIAVLYIERNNVETWMYDFIHWMTENPIGGPFSLVGVYILCEIFFVPGSIISIGAGWALQ